MQILTSKPPFPAGEAVGGKSRKIYFSFPKTAPTSFFLYLYFPNSVLKACTRHWFHADTGFMQSCLPVWKCTYPCTTPKNAAARKVYYDLLATANPENVQQTVSPGQALLHIPTAAAHPCPWQIFGSDRHNWQLKHRQNSQLEKAAHTTSHLVPQTRQPGRARFQPTWFQMPGQ